MMEAMLNGPAAWKKGDKVKLIGIPPDARDDGDLKTRALFEKCLGKVFWVDGVDTFEELDEPLIRLNVGAMLGRAPHMETIWVEPKYLERCG